jgi:hypothetical protein
MTQIMEIKFNHVKEERKALVNAIGEILGCKPVYQYAPSLAYVVGSYNIDRCGTLSFGEQTNMEDAQRLLAELSARGFVGEGDFTMPCVHECSETAPEDGEDFDASKLVIEIPSAGFTPTIFENLERLVSGKRLLIMKALDADALPIERTDATLRFPWFTLSDTGTEAETDAYLRFVHALCEMAKKQKRVMLKEKPVDEGASEKFTFRCFLLRLGFIGKDYASARKVLLSKLSGNGAFKNGGRKSLCAVENAAIVHDSESDSNAGNAPMNSRGVAV